MLPSIEDIGDYEDIMEEARTDRNSNPAAFTTDIAKSAGLVEGTDYKTGDSFTANNHLYYTAHLLGDPIELTIKVIDKIGYYTQAGKPRWTYLDMKKFIWSMMSHDQKRDIVGYHYEHEGGTEMKHLFPNYGKLK